MAEVNAAAAIHATQHNEGTAAGKNQGTLKTPNGEHTITAFSNTEAISEGVNEFLSQQEPGESLELPPMEVIDSEEILQKQEIQENIDVFLEELSAQQEKLPDLPPQGKTEENFVTLQNRSERMNQEQAPQTKGAEKPTQPNQQAPRRPAPSSKIVYPDLFTMARSFNSKSSKEADPAARKMNSFRPNQSDSKIVLGQNLSPYSTAKQQEANSLNHRDNGYEEDQEQNGGSKNQQDEEGSPQQQDQRQQQQQQQKAKKQKKIGKIVKAQGPQSPKVKAAVSQESPSKGKGIGGETLHGIGNIYIRFMALMARILGQAEAEAHQLYLRIKERTDNIDTLTHLISKINSSNGKIDWSKDEEMKQLVDKVRALGVDIPEGKYKWSEDEKKLLKENIQMRKDSMEKITQLERTDMQRFLQEASQCHQARSNVLKLLKEVMDTIIHNMRP